MRTGKTVSLFLFIDQLCPKGINCYFAHGTPDLRTIAEVLTFNFFHYFQLYAYILEPSADFKPKQKYAAVQ